MGRWSPRFHCHAIATARSFALRPAEAAARRLVIVAARDLVVALPPPRPRQAGPNPVSIFVRNRDTRSGIVLPYGVKPSDILPGLAKPHPAPRSLTLPLLDPLPAWPTTRRRQPTGSVPRISVPGYGATFKIPAPPSPHDAIDATHLALRLQAVGRVLDDLPGHARRFARWRGRVAAGAQNKEPRDAAEAQNGDRRAAGDFRRISRSKPGLPPGSRRKPTHEVHEVLADLQYFACHALKRRDTS